MKNKYTIGLLLLLNYAMSQTRTSGLVPLGPGEMAVQIDLNDTNSKVTATLSGPSSKWFSIGLNTDCMCVADCLLYKNNTFYDAQLQGGHNTPIIDVENNWTLVSDIVSNTTRTITITRDYISSDPTDYVFSSSLNSMNIIWAYACDDPSVLFYHCDYFGVQNLNFSNLQTNTLDIELNSITLYPNPATKSITLLTNKAISIDTISIYNAIGQLIVETPINNFIPSFVMDISNLSKGIYFIEISNAKNKITKKFVKL